MILTAKEEDSIRMLLMKIDMMSMDMPTKGKRNALKNTSSRIKNILNKAKRKEKWKSRKNTSRQPSSCII